MRSWLVGACWSAAPSRSEPPAIGCRPVSARAAARGHSALETRARWAGAARRCWVRGAGGVRGARARLRGRYGPGAIGCRQALFGRCRPRGSKVFGPCRGPSYFAWRSRSARAASSATRSSTTCACPRAMSSSAWRTAAACSRTSRRRGDPRGPVCGVPTESSQKILDPHRLPILLLRCASLPTHACVHVKSGSRSLPA